MQQIFFTLETWKKTQTMPATPLRFYKKGWEEKNNLISAALYVQKIRKCRSSAKENPLLCLSGWFIMFQTFLKWFITNQVRVGHLVPSSSSFARDGIAGWVSVSSNSLQRQILEPLNASSREARPGSAISLFTLLVLTASSQLVSAFYLLCSSS